MVLPRPAVLMSPHVARLAQGTGGIQQHARAAPARHTNVHRISSGVNIIEWRRHPAVWEVGCGDGHGEAAGQRVARAAVPEGVPAMTGVPRGEGGGGVRRHRRAAAAGMRVCLLLRRRGFAGPSSVLGAARPRRLLLRCVWRVRAACLGPLCLLALRAAPASMGSTEGSSRVQADRSGRGAMGRAAWPFASIARDLAMCWGVAGLPCVGRRCTGASSGRFCGGGGASAWRCRRGALPWASGQLCAHAPPQRRPPPLALVATHASACVATQSLLGGRGLRERVSCCCCPRRSGRPLAWPCPGKTAQRVGK